MPFSIKRIISRLKVKGWENISGILDKKKANTVFTIAQNKKGNFKFWNGKETKESLVPDNIIAYIKKLKKIYTRTFRTHKS